MDITCWVNHRKLGSSSRDEGRLMAKPFACSNAGHKMTTMLHQPAGMQLLGCIAVQPWTQPAGNKMTNKQVTKENNCECLVINAF